MLVLVADYERIAARSSCAQNTFPLSAFETIFASVNENETQAGIRSFAESLPTSMGPARSARSGD
jgi:hypothetical protein